MSDYALAIMVIVGGPVYCYVITRIMASAIFRSYFETKLEFMKKEVKAV